ncbi:unnamed protein product [Rotaria sp. Silwood2]|nr:unnamed protein product [Rotaria sp. Silwood2]CAF2899516.1 unnamed protein product [Rotaria sp. Silwood2]CAF3984980.1 unnamed protein product [Rotaria sp. Silwood2]CAF3997099.1 unnamed protein product [Rotaria sp. Silwood2]
MKHLSMVYELQMLVLNSLVVVPTTATLISNVQEAYSRYMKDNEEHQKLIKQIDVVNGKRASDAEHERLEENKIELLNKQKNL